MTTPSVAVIVTAHDRKRYLPRALNSLLNQSLPPSRFKTIVVKNFSDAESDALCGSLDADVVQTTAVPQGAKLDIALARCSSEIVALLEDDDVFAPRKLERTIGWFQSEPATSYLHNGYWVLSDGDMGRLQPSVRPGGRKIVRILPATGTGWMRDLRRGGKLYFNSSSISFRPRILAPFRSELRETSLILDIFLFFAALASGGTLAGLAEPLTGVGVGTGNASMGGAPDSSSDRLRELRVFSESILPQHGRIQRLAQNSGIHDIERLAWSELLVERSVGYLRGMECAKGDFFTVARGLSQHADSVFVRANWPTVPLSFFGALWPGLARRIYGSLRTGIPFRP